MRLKIKAFKRLAKEEGYEGGYRFLRSLGAGKAAWSCFRKLHLQIGHDLVKEIYNTVGEEKTLMVIDFEEETINGFKAKYIQIGNKLF